MRKFDQLRNDLLARLDKFEDSIDDQVAFAVGFTVRQRMLQLISKGISPILGKGRFQAYKGQANKAKAREDLKKAKKLLDFRKNNQRYLTKLSRGSRGRLAREKRKQLRLDKKATKAAFELKKKEILGKINKKYYPFSVQSEFPSKKPRPVNLFLSGDFLSNLTYSIAAKGKKKLISIGFLDDLSAKKEQGHREGVNGQPSRPTIPKGTESFAQIIKLDIMKIMKDAIKRAFDK